jgi:hypothetical protein
MLPGIACLGSVSSNRSKVHYISSPYIQVTFYLFIYEDDLASLTLARFELDYSFDRS